RKASSAGGTGSLFTSSRKHSLRRNTHLPPSFTGTRQRNRLKELLERLDLEDATVKEALLKIRPLHPQGFFRRNWDKVLALGVIYTLIIVPYEVGFEVDDLSLRIIGILLDLLFIFDIVLSFRTSYREVNDE